MSQTVLSFQDIVKEPAQSPLKVKTDPLSSFLLFARSFAATTDACQHAPAIKYQSTASTYLLLLPKNILCRTTKSLKGFLVLKR